MAIDEMSFDEMSSSQKGFEGPAQVVLKFNTLDVIEASRLLPENLLADRHLVDTV